MVSGGGKTRAHFEHWLHGETKCKMGRWEPLLTLYVNVCVPQNSAVPGGGMTRRNTYVCERTSTDRYSAIPNGKDSR